MARKRRATRNQILALLLADLVFIGGAVAVGLIVFAPRVNKAKRHDAVLAARQQAATGTAIAAQERVEQQLHVLAFGPRLADPGARAAGGARVRARAALLSATEAAITAAVNSELRAGSLPRGYISSPVLSTSCSRYPAGSPAPSPATEVGSYACMAAEARVRTPTGVVGSVGSPVWARLDFTRARVAWCLINPLPGETATGYEAARVPLAAACDLSRPAPAGF